MSRCDIRNSALISEARQAVVEVLALRDEIFFATIVV